MSKPATAKFRTAFQYNNVMYSAVGECIGRANDSTWEGVISNRIFEPLGMKTSNTSLQEMRNSTDFTIGYHLPSKNPLSEKTHDFYNVAASGGINSSARDLVRWIQLMLGHGVFDGKRLVSEAGFRQLITPANGHYALGWEVIDIDGHTMLISEGGAVGHAARITIDLDAHTGWALLANVNNVHEFRQMANIVEVSLRPMPHISRWSSAANVIAFLLWLTTLGFGVGAVALSKRRGHQSRVRGHNYLIGLSFRRRLRILLAAGMLICASVALHHSMSTKPWLIVHLPALESIKLGMLCCGFVVLATGLCSGKNTQSIKQVVEE